MRLIERTCCICRSKADKRSLLRLVVSNGELIVDESQRLPGRGGYIHPTPDCLSRMGQVGRWERALRVEGRGLEQTQVARLAMELMKRFNNGVEDSTPSSKGGRRPGRGIRL